MGENGDGCIENRTVVAISSGSLNKEKRIWDFAAIFS
jgi:hypothetical protein